MVDDPRPSPETRAGTAEGRVLDVESAACAELPVILVVGGSSTRDELAQTGQSVVESLGALRSLLPDRPPPA